MEIFSTGRSSGTSFHLLFSLFLLNLGTKKEPRFLVILSLCTEFRYIFIFLLHRNKHIHQQPFHHMLLYPVPSVFHKLLHDVLFLLSGEFHTLYDNHRLHKLKHVFPYVPTDLQYNRPHIRYSTPMHNPHKLSPAHPMHPGLHTAHYVQLLHDEQHASVLHSYADELVLFLSYWNYLCYFHYLLPVL